MLREQREGDNRRSCALQAIDRECEALARECLQLRYVTDGAGASSGETERLSAEALELKTELSRQFAAEAETAGDSMGRAAAAEAQLALLDQLDQARTELRESRSSAVGLQDAPADLATRAVVDRVAAQLAAARDAEAASLAELAEGRRVEATLRAEVEASRRELDKHGTRGPGIPDLTARLTAMRLAEVAAREEAAAMREANARLKRDMPLGQPLSGAAGDLRAQLALARSEEAILRDEAAQRKRAVGSVQVELIAAQAELKAARSDAAVASDLQARLALANAQKKQLLDEVSEENAMKNMLRTEVNQLQRDLAARDSNWRLEAQEAATISTPASTTPPIAMGEVRPAEMDPAFHIPGPSRSDYTFGSGSLALADRLAHTSASTSVWTGGAHAAPPFSQSDAIAEIWSPSAASSATRPAACGSLQTPSGSTAPAGRQGFSPVRHRQWPNVEPVLGGQHLPSRGAAPPGGATAPVHRVLGTATDRRPMPSHDLGASARVLGQRSVGSKPTFGSPPSSGPSASACGGRQGAASRGLSPSMPSATRVPTQRQPGTAACSRGPTGAS